MKPEIARDIYIIPVRDKFILYAPLLKVTAMINRKATQVLKRILSGAEEMPIDHSALQDLIKELNKVPLESPQPSKGRVSPLFLGFITTRNCNSACIYCDFGASTALCSAMDLHKAVAAVDWFTQIVKEQGRDTLDIHFFGGEPMIAPKVVQTVVHYARMVAARENLIPYFEISTNGIYKPSLVNFIGAYMDAIILSFDGPADIQNLHRPLRGGQDSFNQVYTTAKILSESNAQLILRSCISQINVNRMEDIARWFCETINPSVINFEIMQSSERTAAKNLCSPDPFEFVVNFIKARKVAESYGVKTIYASDLTDELILTSCPVGRDSAIVSPDDRISSCYLLQEKWKEVGLDLDIGKVDAAQNIVIDQSSVENIRNMVIAKPRCEKCFCKWSCAGGCHVGNTYPGCGPEYTDYCFQTRVISACTLLFEMDLREEIDLLIDNYTSMKNIATHSSDLLIEIGN